VLGRDTIYELLIMIQPKLTEFKESIEGVVIDGFNRAYGTYSASIYMNVDGISLKRTMIPSHAIFLALLFNKPVYVTAEVVQISKELESEENDDDEGFFSEDEDDEF
jgi:bifunctional DNase/RNase